MREAQRVSQEFPGWDAVPQRLWNRRPWHGDRRPRRPLPGGEQGLARNHGL